MGSVPAREEIVEKVFPIPTVLYNAVYQLLHIYKHLFESGIGLRQLMDFYFVLRALHIERPNMRLVTHYLEEVMWEPVFGVYHWIWRRFELWRW